MATSVLEGLQLIVDSEAPLTSVIEHRFESDPGFLVALELRFGSQTLALIAESDFDTLAVVTGPPRHDPQVTAVNVSDSEPWSHAVGSQPAWAWQLTNHQGYVDGARLEFPRTVVEFVVVASCLKVSVARES